MKIQRMGEKIDWKPEMFAPLTPEQLEEAKALIDASFTAEDLQRFTEICEDVPYEQLEAEMDAAIQKFEQGRE